jgi:RNA polymerase sigma-70 factor (ECF subfamily)
VTDEAMPLAVAGVDWQEGRTERLAALFDAHHGRLYRLARRLAGSHDEARDLVQETFLRIASRAGGCPRDLRSEEAWLVSVMVNIARNTWRKQRGRRALDARHLRETTAAAPAPPESAVIAKHTIWQAMRQVPPRRRAALILYELEGVTVPRIAGLLGISAVTVRWHLAQGRRDLARIIGRDGRHD